MPGSGVVIVGASAAGLAVAQRLRARGYREPVTLLGAEAHLPYDRPPLSKQVLAGSSTPASTRLADPDELARLNVELVLGHPAIKLDVERRTVSTLAGEWTAEHVVLATGATPRTVLGQDGLPGVHVLRTIDDASRLRTELLRSTRTVIVGDGVLGAEIAAVAANFGNYVTLVGRHRAPMANQLGDLAAGLLARIHAEHEVTLRRETSVSGFANHLGTMAGVTLDTGDTLAADLVIVAIGVEPATRWLTSSGLRLCDGIVCDAACTAAEGIYAVGDVARFYHQYYADWVRLENRTNATEQAIVVADNIMGDARRYVPVPYFWTDQYDTRIQVHGAAAPGADFVIVDGDVAGRRFVGEWHLGGQTTGVLGWNMPKQTRIRRQLMTADAPIVQ